MRHSENLSTRGVERTKAGGAVLQGKGDVAGAAASFLDRVESLKPLSLRSPEAFKRLMTDLVREYVGACEMAGVEPDRGLLGEILPRCARHYAVGGATGSLLTRMA